MQRGHRRGVPASDYTHIEAVRNMSEIRQRRPMAWRQNGPDDARVRPIRKAQGRRNNNGRAKNKQEDTNVSTQLTAALTPRRACCRAAQPWDPCCWPGWRLPRPLPWRMSARQRPSPPGWPIRAASTSRRTATCTWPRGAAAATDLARSRHPRRRSIAVTARPARCHGSCRRAASTASSPACRRWRSQAARSRAARSTCRSSALRRT